MAQEYAPITQSRKVIAYFSAVKVIQKNRFFPFLALKEAKILVNELKHHEKLTEDHSIEPQIFPLVVMSQDFFL